MNQTRPVPPAVLMLLCLAAVLAVWFATLRPEVKLFLLRWFLGPGAPGRGLPAARFF